MYSHAGHGSYPFVAIPLYWEAVISGVLGLLAFWVFFLFKEEKPLARRLKILVISLLLFLLSAGSVLQGMSVPYNPWTDVPVGPITSASYPPLSPWMNDSIGMLGLVFIVLLARDYQWLTWVRWWLDAFVFNKPLSEPPPAPRR